MSSASTCAPATLRPANALAQLLTVPPYAVATFLFASDRLQSRGIFIAIFTSIAGIGYLLLLTVHVNNHVRYSATFCIPSGTYIPRYYHCVVCPQSWIEDEESRHLQISYRMDIVRRNRLHGKTVDNARLDTRELADKVPSGTCLEN